MKKSAEEQVAQLTEEEKTKIFKAGKYGLLAELIGAAVIILFFLLFGEKFINIPRVSDVARTGFILGFSIVAASVYFIVVFIVVKVVCPQYSDKKYFQIKKERKNSAK